MHTRVRAESNLKFSIDFLKNNVHYVEIQKIFIITKYACACIFQKTLKLRHISRKGVVTGGNLFSGNLSANLVEKMLQVPVEF